MKKLGSLIYRELAISKKYYLLNLFGVVIITALAWLAKLSLEVGNLQRLADADSGIYETVNMMLYVYSIAFPAYMIGTLMTNYVPQTDIKSGWKKYSLSLPISDAERFLVKAVTRMSIFAVGMIVLLINVFVVSAVFDKKVTIELINALILLIDFTLLIIASSEILQFWANTEKELNLASVPTIVILAVSFAVVFRMKDGVMNALNEAAVNDPSIMEDENLMAQMPVIFGYLKDKFDDLLVLAIPLMLVIFAVWMICIYFAVKRRYK